MTSKVEEAPAARMVRRVVDEAFGRRMQSACDANPHVPDMNYGRLTWLQVALQEKFRLAVSVESVRKWMNGEARPRPASLSKIAQVLGVDEAWLSLGIQPDMSQRERKARNATADGVVNVLAGFIQMAGGHPAFPAADDERAERQAIQLYAIIKGANYAINVSLAKLLPDNTYLFHVPTTHDSIFVIGVIECGGFAVDFIEISSETVEQKGKPKGGYIDVVLTQADVDKRMITTFAERL